MNKKVRIYLGIISIILLLVFMGFYDSQEEKEVNYTTIQNTKLLNSVQATGIVVPEKTITIKSEIAAIIEELNASEGEQVEVATPLINYDAKLVAADVEKAKINLDQAQVSLEQAKTSLNQAELAVELTERRVESAAFIKDKSLEERINQAGIDLKEAEQELSRLKRLEKKGAVGEVKVNKQDYKVKRLKSQQELLKKELAELKENKKNRVAEAKVEFKRSKSSYQVAYKNYLIAKKAVAAAKSAYNKQQLIQARYLVRAPIKGRIIEQKVEAGEYVQPGQKLMEIASDKLLLKISPDERELSLIELGKQGVAVTEANPNQEFAVEVTKIDSKVDPNRGTVDVYLDSSVDKQRLLPNMSVSVELISNKNEKLIFLEDKYIFSEEKQKYVYLYQQGQAIKQPIKIERSYNGSLKVEKGLSVGDKVIDPAGISEGQKIQLKRGI